MDNDEILKRMKKHYIFFENFRGQVDDEIIEECIRSMEKLFINLLKNNNMKSKL